MRPARFPLVLVAALAAVATPGYAADSPNEGATTKETCREAYEGAQAHRKKNELLAARQSLRTCGSFSCPDVVRGDCVEWLSEVERSLPSVVFGAKTDAGDVYDVSVALDGKTVVTELDGRAIELDPGRHTFEFTRAGSPPLTRTEIIREGEKVRAISVSWETFKPPPLAASREAPPVPTYRPIPAWTYILGGVGVVGLGTFAYFGLDGNNRKNTLSGCSPFCDPSQVDVARRSFLVADVALGVGAAAFVGSAIVWLFRPARPVLTGAPTIVPVPAGAVFAWSNTL
jgi:hypothetical protein